MKCQKAQETEVTKYKPIEYWYFAWSNGTPQPFIMPEVGAPTRKGAKIAACEWYRPDMTWGELYAMGGRVVRCRVTPFQRKPISGCEHPAK